MKTFLKIIKYILMIILCVLIISIVGSCASCVNFSGCSSGNRTGGDGKGGALFPGEGIFDKPEWWPSWLEWLDFGLFPFFRESVDVPVSDPTNPGNSEGDSDNKDDNSNSDNKDDNSDSDNKKPEEVYYVVSFFDSESHSLWDSRLPIKTARIKENTTIGAEMPDDLIPEAVEPTLLGCPLSFEGWYADDILITANTVVTGNLTVRARFETKSHEIEEDKTEDDDGHECCSYSCSNCGYVFGKGEPHTIHEYKLTETYVDDCGHECTLSTCTICSKSFENTNHVFDEFGNCTLCSAEKSCEHEFVGHLCIKCGNILQFVFKNDNEGGDTPSGSCDEHVDEDSDGTCDICGESVGNGNEGGGNEGGDTPSVSCDEHVDEDLDGTCDICGESVGNGNVGGDNEGGDNEGGGNEGGGNEGGTPSGSCDEHVDEDLDGTCDICGESVGNGNVGGGHEGGDISGSGTHGFNGIFLPTQCECDCNFCLGENCSYAETGECNCNMSEDIVNCGCTSESCNCSATGVCEMQDCNCKCHYEVRHNDIAGLLNVGYLFDGNGNLVENGEGARIAIVFEAPQIRNFYGATVTTHISEESPLVEFSIFALDIDASRLFGFKRISYEVTYSNDFQSKGIISNFTLTENKQFSCAGSFKVGCAGGMAGYDGDDWQYLCLVGDPSCGDGHLYIIRVYMDYLLDLSNLVTVHGVGDDYKPTLGSAPGHGVGDDYKPTVEFVRFKKTGEMEVYIHTDYRYIISQFNYYINNSYPSFAQGDYVSDTLYATVCDSSVNKINPFGGFYSIPIIIGQNWGFSADHDFDHGSEYWYNEHFHDSCIDIYLESVNYYPYSDLVIDSSEVVDFNSHIETIGEVEFFVYTFYSTEYEGIIIVDIYCPNGGLKFKLISTEYSDDPTVPYDYLYGEYGFKYKYRSCEYGAILSFDLNNTYCYDWLISYLKIIITGTVVS